MKTIKHTVSHVLLTAFGAIIGGIAVILIHGGVSYFPVLEGYLFPVVKVVSVGDITRTKDQACFTITLHKVREAEVIKYQFMSEVAQNGHWLAPTTIYAEPTPETDDPNAVLRHHQIGDTWPRRWCFDVPAIVSDNQVMRITGMGVHRSHPFWLTDTPMPAFPIGALKS